MWDEVANEYECLTHGDNRAAGKKLTPGEVAKEFEGGTEDD